MRETVIKQISEERRRQAEDLGWTPESDDRLTQGQLASMAAGYAFGSRLYVKHPTMGNSPAPAGPAAGWPHEYALYKPEDPRSDLIKAAALIVAEIERLDRAEARGEANG